MRHLPQHRTAATLLAFVLLGAGVSYWFLVHPLHTRIADNEQQVEKKRKGLQVAGYPLDSELLEKELQDLKAQIDGGRGKPGLRETSERVLVKATRMFLDRILASRMFPGLSSPELFRQRATWASFQSEFGRIALKLAERNTFLAPSVLGISDESSSPYVYQLILQAWTVEQLADLAAEEGLTIAFADGVELDHGDKKVKAADIRLLDVRGYVLADSGESPYLVEFPVQASLLGELGQVESFLRKLTSGGNFMPATHVEIYTDDPASPVYHDGQQVKVNKVRVKVRCSSFFSLGLSRESVAKSPQQLPGGA